MTNQELADSFRNRVDNFNKEVPLDYYDRAVDFAIYVNETTSDSLESAQSIQLIQDGMVVAYVARDEVFEVK